MSAFEQMTSQSIAEKLIAIAQERAFMKPVEGCPGIPELVCKASETANKFYTYFTHQKRYKTWETLDVFYMTAVWCGYAGIGATVLWQRDRTVFQGKGIFETLKKPYGVSDMEDFIYELIGIKYGSQEALLLYDHLFDLAIVAINQALKRVEDDIEPEQDERAETLLNGFSAMFLWGMAYEISGQEK